jgi:predicted CXXCH cytochrome family protein
MWWHRSMTRVGALALLLALPAAVGGGDWHSGTRLVCSDCHTIHNSSRGQPMRYDGSPVPVAKLLRSANSTELCKACHDGTNARAPNVMRPTTADPPGGGFPSDPADPQGHAHQLTGIPILPPGGDTPVAMGCTTCHDPHGSAQYRNLRQSPSGTDRAADNRVQVHQTVTADGTNPAAVYKLDNLVDVSGMTQFCLDCHNQYDATPNWHPYDASIWGSALADYEWWATGEFSPRARVQNPGFVPGGSEPAVPSHDDQVYCLTCHKAHGSTNPRMMLDVGDPSDSTSLCNQCHNK